MHESKSHASNCFITLTYDDIHLPDGKTLVLKDFQDFMKRLRKKFGSNIRFYHCGEYGDLNGRPHYHALIFGMDFPDKIKFAENANGDSRFRSDILSRLWPLGMAETGDVTFQSAAYVARYVMKKVTGDAADYHYAYLDSTGAWQWRAPEYSTMSRGRGIGAGFLDRFMDDIYPNDFVIVNGREVRPPRFYDKNLEKRDPRAFESLKTRRIRNAKKHSDNNSPDRLKVREEVLLSKLGRLTRKV